jgi:hypothetical protein
VRAALTLAAAFVAVLVGTTNASASYLVTRNAHGVSLRISGATAIVGYTTYGSRHHALLSGAVNARSPRAGVPQVAFRVRYGLGGKGGGSCRPYTGPELVFAVAACDGPDGSHWALQTWRRLQPNFGGVRAPWELHASHWTGDLPKLEVWLDWSYAGRYQHLFGRYTYNGAPVHGFSSTHRGSPRDSYGRNLYLDTYDSWYGQGWRRENSFLSHRGTGVFCYGFYPHRGRPGTGAAYRLVVQGPGVTPLVSWTAQSQGSFDADLDSEMNALQRSLGDRLCRHG